MDRDGVEGEILYTSFGLSMFSIPDADFQHACFRAFNDWLAEYCAGVPRRLFGVAMIPTDPKRPRHGGDGALREDGA